MTIASLPEETRLLLCAMAVFDMPVSPRYYAQLIKLLEYGKPRDLTYYNPAWLDVQLGQLQQEYFAAPYGAGQHAGIQLKPVWQVRALAYLQQQGELVKWLNRVRSVGEQSGMFRQWQSHTAYFHRREALHAALRGEPESYINALNHLLYQWPFDWDIPLALLLRDAAGIAVFQGLLPDMQELMLETSLAITWRHGIQADVMYAYTGQLLTEQAALRDKAALCEQLCWQALMRGDSARFAVYAAHLHTVAISPFAAVEAVLRGEYARALPLFEVFLKEIRLASGRRKLAIPGYAGLLYTLALLHKNDAALYKRAKEQIDEGNNERASPVYLLLSPVLHHLQSGKPVQLPDVQNFMSEGAESLLAVLAFYLANAKPPGKLLDSLRGLRQKLMANGYVWLAAECDVLLQRLDEDLPPLPLLPDWHAAHGYIALVDIVPHQAGWQRALQALLQLRAPANGAAAAGAAESRIVWMLDLRLHQLSILPYEQKKSARGSWSKGRAIALRRLLKEPETLPGMLEQDRALALCIHASQAYDERYNEYWLDTEAALLQLCGHPQVYWLDAPGNRIEVIKAEAALNLTQKKGQIKLQLDPPLQASGKVAWRRETPTRLLVYAVSPALRKIVEILGPGVQMPHSAQAQLVEAIGVLAPHLAIHSDLPEMGAHIESIAADATLYAHLLPLREGLRLQFLVRPLSDGGWFAPGCGPANVLGEKDGRTVQASRLLKKEKTCWQQVVGACTSLAQAEQDGQEWHIEHPQTCLEVLEDLKRQPPEVLQLVWPEGEKYRLKGSRSMRDMRLNIRRQGDWFVTEGAIELDDGRVLALRELLQLSRESSGRYLQLGENDYLALTDSLRKRLAQLQAFGEGGDKDGVRINPLAAHVLAEIAAEAGQVNADTAWQEQMQKLDALALFEPELPSTLQAQLRDYQVQGFAWLARLAEWGVGACLADDMGLGKTVQALALLLTRASGGPALVVAPISVALNWQAEVARFAPTLKVRAYHQQRSLDDLGAFDLVIVSYTLLQIDAAQFAAQHWHSVVLDEAQVIKNAATKRSQAAMALQADFRMIASGTPMENHLGELWNLFRFINPGLLGSREKFNQRFAAPIERGDKAAQQHLKKLIQPFILRRSKNQVLSELPSRTEITLHVSLSEEERHLYEALRQEALDNLSQLPGEENKALHVLAEITRLRRFCCNPKLVLRDSQLAGSKLAVFAEVVQELIDNRHKALVFSQFTDHLAIVRAWLDENDISYQYLDGSIAPAERKKRVDAFQAGQGDVFLISLKAGGTGLNLTAADYVIHLDPWWNPAVEDQASDRAHRMGQQRPVTIYRLVTEATIEEKILALHAAKRDLADTLLDGGDAAGKLDTAALLQLLKEGAAAEAG